MFCSYSLTSHPGELLGETALRIPSLKRNALAIVSATDCRMSDPFSDPVFVDRIATATGRCTLLLSATVIYSTHARPTHSQIAGQHS